MISRRQFLTSILATCTAPAIVRADSLMRIKPVQFAFERSWALPLNEWIHIDYNVVNELLSVNGRVLPKGDYVVTDFRNGQYSIELPALPAMRDGDVMDLTVSSDRSSGSYSFASSVSMPQDFCSTYKVKRIRWN